MTHNRGMTFPFGFLRSEPAHAVGSDLSASLAGGSARWRVQALLLVGGALWLLWLVAMFSHDPADAAFSTTGDGELVRNRVGQLGAWVSDLCYVFAGLTSWWGLAYALRVWLATLAGLWRADPEAARVVGPVHWRPRWLAWVGLALLMLGSAVLEWTRVYTQEASLSGGHAGGILGAEFGPLAMRWLGFTGSGVLCVAMVMLGMAWAFRFSWLGLSEGIGGFLEGLRHRREAQREHEEDRRIGRRAQEERERDVDGELHTRAFADTVSLPEVPGRTVETDVGVTERPARTRPAERGDASVTAPERVRTPAVEPAAPALARERQQPLFSELRGKLPQIDLLDAPTARVETVSADSLEMTSRLIEKKLKDFGVSVQVVAAQPGPVITRYEIEPATGVKGSQIVNLAKDLARSLSLVSIRVVETIPGKNCMALELPNAKRLTIRLSEILGSQAYRDAPSLLAMGLGKDIVGHPVVSDLAKMPHVLVAGTTGSGKSVGINAMILSLLYKAEPQDVRLIMIDPKMLEMSVYEGIPHLLAPVVTDMKQASNALTWCVAEMERRYKLMSKMGVRNLAGFNKKMDEAKARGELVPNPFSLTPEAPEPLERLPHIVVVIDELADLMMVVGKKIEELIARLAQKARAAGIHLILATQRPSVDVITGLIKANIPTRMSFQVSSKIDSRTILDQGGAEALLGQGDMLYLAPGTGLPTRVHGAFCSDDEVHRVVEYLKTQGEPNYIEGILEGGVLEGAEGNDTNAEGGGGDAEADPMYDQAVAVVLQHRRASISLVQRHLRIGYNRAARLLEQMEKSGLVSGMATNGNRDLLVPARNDE